MPTWGCYRCGRPGPMAGLLKGALAVGQSRDTDATPKRRSIARIAAVIGILALAAGVSRLCVLALH
jgi:hypothetical protein